jgi:iron complex outermembrane receptor protein
MVQSIGLPRFLLVVAVSVVAWPNAGRGATNDASSDNDKSTLEEVVVTGQHLTAPKFVPLETTYSEGTITAEELRTLSPGPSTTVETLLNKQPSIIAFTDGPLGTRTNINFRAFNSGEFAQTYDGVALNDLFNGAVTNQASNINNVLLRPSNVDSVEIYRGINNPAVNSYNSLGGTIDFLPRRPAGKFDAEVTGSYGSFATAVTRAAVNFDDFHGLNQLLSYEYAKSDGWSSNTNDRNNNFYYSADMAQANGDRLSAFAVFNENTGYTPFNMPVPLLETNGDYYQWPKSWTYEYDKNTNWLAIADYLAHLSDSVLVRNKIFGGASDYKRTSFSNPAYQESATQIYNLENDPVGGSPPTFWLPNPSYDPNAVFGSLAAGTDYHFYGYKTWGAGDSVSAILLLPKNTVTIGGNVTYGELYSREYWYGTFDMPQVLGYNDAWDEHDRRTLFSAYAQDEIGLFDDNLHVTPGVKYVHANTSDHDAIGFYYSRPGTVGDSESFTSPTLGVNYKVNSDLAFYGAFGRNIKFPDITAYYNSVTSSGIAPLVVKPEYVNDYELGARYRKGGYSAMLNVYRENFENTFINKIDPNTGLTTVSNGGSSRYQGVEAQLAADLGRTAIGDWSGYLNYAYNEAKFTRTFTTYAGISVVAGTPLANVPRQLLSAGIVWQMAGWRADIEVRHVGLQYIDQYSGTPNATNNSIPAYTLVNIGAAKTLDLQGAAGFKSLRIALNLDNLFDKYYFNEAYTDFDNNGNSFVRAVPGAPRIIAGTVSVRF